MKEIEIKLTLGKQTEAALFELLPYFHQYENKEDGGKPFADLTEEDLFRFIIQVESLHTIWHRIKREQFRNGLITVTELNDNQYMTVAERKEARAAAGIQEADHGEETP